MSKSNTSLSTAQVTQGLDADLASKPAAAQAARGLNADLASILDSLEGAEAIKLKFKEEEIYTLACARSLTEQDLEKLGFKMGKRKDILEALHPASGPPLAQPSAAGLVHAYEGVVIDEPLTLKREALCARVHEKLEQHRAVLLRSPPMSGKTSLGALFAAWCRAKSHQVVLLSLLPVNTSTLVAAENEFQREWQRATGGAGDRIDILGQLDKLQQPCVYIVDEAQRAYDLADFMLWRLVKGIQQRGYTNVRLFCLSGYTPALLAGGASTPVAFTPEAILQLDDLRLRGEERNELYQRFGEQLDVARCIGVLPQSALQYISNASGGHAGLVRLYLQFLLERFRDIHGRAPEEDVLTALMEPEFIHRARSQRIFPPHAGGPQQELLLSLVRQGRAITLLHAAEPLYMAAVSLAKQGMLVVTRRGANAPEEVDFAAPVVRQVALSRFIIPNVTVNTPRFESLTGVLEYALMRFNPEHLRLSLTRSSDDDNAPLWEAQWQSEFYMATAESLPRDTTISPEVGRIFDSDGRLDFIVNGKLGWGVELLRNSDRLGKHVARFETGGIYHGMVKAGKVKDWVVLDFCSPSTTPRPEHKHPRVWRIVYDDTYTSATIHRVGIDPLTVPFRGDYAEQHRQMTSNLPPATPPRPLPTSAPAPFSSSAGGKRLSLLSSGGEQKQQRRK